MRNRLAKWKAVKFLISILSERVRREGRAVTVEENLNIEI